MKVLSRNEMKKLVGGVTQGTVVGTRGSSAYGFCFCDIQPDNGGPVVCEEPCPVQVCDWMNSQVVA